MDVVHILVSMSAAPVALLKLIELMSISPIMFDFTLNRYNGMRRDWRGSEVLITIMALVRIDRNDREKPDWSMNSSVRIMLHMYNEVFKTVSGHGSCIGDNIIGQKLDINKNWCSFKGNNVIAGFNARSEQKYLSGIPNVTLSILFVINAMSKCAMTRIDWSMLPKLNGVFKTVSGHERRRGTNSIENRGRLGTGFK